MAPPILVARLVLNTFPDITPLAEPRNMAPPKSAKFDSNKHCLIVPVTPWKAKHHQFSALMTLAEQSRHPICLIRAFCCHCRRHAL